MILSIGTCVRDLPIKVLQTLSNSDFQRPTAQKYYLAGLICFGVFFVNFVAAGPAVAIEQIAVEFFGDAKDPSEMIDNISTVAYIQTVSSLMIGVGNLVWVPLAIKYGRRPVYIAAWLLMTGSTIWGGCAKSFASELAARIVYGCAGAAPEIVAALVLTDLFFLHQRGAVMVCVPRPLVLSLKKGCPAKSTNRSVDYTHVLSPAELGLELSSRA